MFAAYPAFRSLVRAPRAFDSKSWTMLASGDGSRCSSAIGLPLMYRSGMASVFQPPHLLDVAERVPLAVRVGRPTPRPRWAQTSLTPAAANFAVRRWNIEEKPR